MNRDKIIQSLILGVSLMFSVGIISLVNVYAGQDSPGNNEDIYRPINEGPDEQVKQGSLFLNKVTFENRDSMSSNLWDDGVTKDSFNNIIPFNVSGRQVTIENGQMAVWGRIYGDTLGAEYYIDPNSYSSIYSLGIAADLTVSGTTTLQAGTAFLDGDIDYDTSNEKSIVDKKYVDNLVHNLKYDKPTFHEFKTNYDTKSSYKDIVIKDDPNMDSVCTLGKVRFVDAEPERSRWFGQEAKVYYLEGKWRIYLKKDGSDQKGEVTGSATCFSVRPKKEPKVTSSSDEGSSQSNDDYADTDNGISDLDARISALENKTISVSSSNFCTVTKSYKQGTQYSYGRSSVSRTNSSTTCTHLTPNNVGDYIVGGENPVIISSGEICQEYNAGGFCHRWDQTYLLIKK